MSKTKGELISDIELRLTKGKPSDDIEIERDQINHWLDIASNTILADSLMKESRSFDDIDSSYIKASDYKTVYEENVIGININTVNRRYYISIDDLDILSFRGHYRDYGIVRLHDKRNNQLTEITYDDSDYYKYLWFSKPDCNNLQWYREGGKIYIDGIDSGSINNEKFRVFYVASIDTLSLDDDEKYPLADGFLSVVSDLAEEIGRKQIYESIADVENDGKDI